MKTAFTAGSQQSMDTQQVAHNGPHIIHKPVLI